MLVRIEMRVPDDLDPSDLLERMQDVALDYYDYPDSRRAELVRNDVSVEVLE